MLPNRSPKYPLFKIKYTVASLLFFFIFLTVAIVCLLFLKLFFPVFNYKSEIFIFIIFRLDPTL